ncbi:MAG: transporter substrate-binding domain-containing protein [Chloroflexota bacterium]
MLQDATFRPMEFEDEKGAIVGFDTDLAEAFAQSLGVNPRSRTSTGTASSSASSRVRAT